MTPSQFARNRGRQQPIPVGPDGAAAKQSRLRVFIVDDHPLIREGMTHSIERDEGLTVCGEAEDAREAVAKINACKPDVAIVDLSLKTTHGLELIKDLRIHQPELPILVLSMHDESLYGERVLRAGAKGYVNKQEATKNIVQAIKTVAGGGAYISARLNARMMERIVAGYAGEKETPIERLNDRELEVFQLLGLGRSTREIAAELRLGVKTVETYRFRIKEKLKIAESTQLVKHATEWVHNLQDRA